MGPRKSASDWSQDSGYPGLLLKLCKEGEVFVLPQFVPVYVRRQSQPASPRKSKESRVGDKRASSAVLARDSLKDDLSPCDSSPPQIGIMYDTPEDKESPVGVICRNIYLEYSLVHAIAKSLKPYPTIGCLRIESCCLTRHMADEVAHLLAEEPGRRISDLSLDGNEDIGSVLPLFVTLPTGVKYLSLRRCSLEDDDVETFAKALQHSDEREQKLQVLNLGMNKIRDAGLSHLANALRTNRCLTSLSLAGNQIGDEGVEALAAVLQKFPLTFEEVMLRRRRIFDEIYKKKNAMEKYLEEWKTKGDAESQTSRASVSEGAVWCNGCWSLANLNLAYNYLTDKSVETFTEVFSCQTENFPPRSGLLRLVLLPGNSIHENSVEFQKLQSSIISHNSKKDFPETSAAVSVGSAASPRRNSSPTRRGRNR